MAGASARVLVRRALHQPMLYQPPQALAQHGARGVQVPLKVVKSRYAVECFAQDQQHPPVAEQFGGMGEAALILRDRRSGDAEWARRGGRV